MQLNQTQQKLAAENFNLVFAFLKKYNLDAEEYTDILMIGLCQAAGTYNGSAKFTTYAYKCMYNEMLLQKRKEKKLSVIPNHLIISIDNFINENENVTYGDMISDDVAESHITSQIYSSEIKSLLTDKEVQIVKYLDMGLTLQEIANIFDVSKQCVSNWRNKIRNKVSLYLYPNKKYH